MLHVDCHPSLINISHFHKALLTAKCLILATSLSPFVMLVQLFNHPNAFYSIFYKHESDSTNEHIIEANIKIMSGLKCAVSLDLIKYYEVQLNCT